MILLIFSQKTPVRPAGIGSGNAVGPFVGAGLAHLDVRLPFIVSALLGALAFLAYYPFGERDLAPVDRTRAPVSFIGVGRILLQDKRLVCFTIGGLLSALGPVLCGFALVGAGLLAIAVCQQQRCQLPACNNCQ